LNVLLYLPLHDQQRRVAAHRSIDGFGEEVAQLDHALSGMGEFVGDRTAHCRRMHTKLSSHVFDHHRLETVDPVVEELRLTTDDGLANLDNDVLPLFEVLEKLKGIAEAVPEIILNLLF